MAERGIGHGLVQNRIVDAVEFEREEQQMDRRRREPLLYVAVKLGAGGIERVAGVDETRKRRKPAHEIVDGFITPHRRGQSGAAIGSGGYPGQLALVSSLETGAFSVSAIEIALDRRIGKAGIKVVQIPFWQSAKTRRTGSNDPLSGGFACNLGHAWV